MYSKKNRIISGCLLRVGTVLTGLGWSTSREYPRLISAFICVSFLWDRESPFLQMGNHGDTKWLVWSHTGNLWWGKKRESDRSSKVPHLSPNLFPVAPRPVVGCWSGVVRAPAPVASLTETLWSSPSYTAWVSDGHCCDPALRPGLCIHPPLATEKHCLSEKREQVGEEAQENQAQPPPGPAQSLDLHLGSLIVGYQQWKYIWKYRVGNLQPGSQAPWWSWDQLTLQHARSLRQIPLGLPVVTGKYSLLGGLHCTQESCHACPHTPALFVGCLHEETGGNIGNVLLWRKESIPCWKRCIREKKKGTNEFSKAIFSSH